MMRGRTLVALAAAAVLLALPGTANAQLKFKPCDSIQCGRISVPLDRSGATSGSVSLYIERQRARRRPARGVTMLLAGGPGQPSTFAYNDGSDDPYGEFGRLSPRNDVVAFDGRGTGRSGLLRCPELERANLVDAGSAAAACARRLGPHRAFYRTSDSVDDMEAVRAALGVDKLTLVGVSYGTFLAQAYAARYPTHVDRVLLDSVLDVSGWDPFYIDIFGAVPRVLRAVCRQTCRGFTEDEVADLARLVKRLGRGALHGRVTLPDGRQRRSSLTRQELFFTMVSGDLDEILRASFPGAVGSALRGDPAPMLRLKRQAVASEGGGSPREFSSGLYAATTCEEIPFPWPRFSDPASRFGPIHTAVAAIPAAALYPFDAATDEGNDFLRMCRRWPEASPAPAAGPPAGSLPDVPVLMLSGQMDLRTPNATARSAAADWPHAKVLTIPNTGHSVLTADFSGCAVGAARRFLRGRSVPARCRGGVPLLYALPPAPLSLRELRAARGVRGARGQAINAVQLTVLDVTLESLSSLFATSKLKLHGGGLRGGRWWVNLGGRDPFIRMRRIEYLPGVFVSGTVHKLGTRRELSNLRVSGPRTPDGTLRIGRKTITGVLGGRPVRSRVPGAAAAAAASAPGPTVARDELVRALLRLAKRPRLR
jgi:pimeloyl-ACP methyl ester carboxylesterase